MEIQSVIIIFHSCNYKTRNLTCQNLLHGLEPSHIYLHFFKFLPILSFKFSFSLSLDHVLIYLPASSPASPSASMAKRRKIEKENRKKWDFTRETHHLNVNSPRDRTAGSSPGCAFSDGNFTQTRLLGLL